MKAKSIRGMSFFILGCLLLFLSGGFVQAQIEKWVYEQTEVSKAFSNVYEADGDIYAAGYFGQSSGMDFVIVRIDTTGVEEWVYEYNGAASNKDEANAVIYGDDGNIYAAGYSTGIGTNMDFTVISVDSEGTERWIYTYNGSASGEDEANAVVYGDDGNIYAAGYSTGSSAAEDFTVVCLDPDGNEMWVYTYDGSASGEDEASAVIYGDDGNIYAAGYSTGTGVGKQFTVISINTLGVKNWDYTYNRTGSQDDVASSIVYECGNIYAAGYSTGSGTNKDFTVIGLDSGGDENWIYTYNGPASNADGANSIVYGVDDNIYAAGYSTGSGTYRDFTVVSVNNAGSERWVYTRNGSGSTPVDEAYAVVYGADDNIYAAGKVERGSNHEDFSVISIDALGQENWFYHKDGGAAPANKDEAHSIVYGTDGNLHAAGHLNMRKFAVISIDPRLLPEMYVSPDLYYIPLDSGTTTERTLEISNNGYITLEWNISERPEVDWMSVDIAIGSADPGDTAYVTVIFDATYLNPDFYYDTLVVSGNDPYNPVIDVPVRMNVRPSGIEEYQPTTMGNKCELLSSFFNQTISMGFTQPSDSPLDIALYDVLGTRMYEISIQCTPSFLNLDDKRISNLAHGVYFLSVSQPEMIYPVKKLIKF